MSPSQVREKIMSDHEEIKSRLHELEPLVAAVKAGARGRAPELRQRVAALIERLHTHIDLEDEILAPALKAVDPYFVLYGDELRREHRRQRGELDQLRRAVHSDAQDPVRIAKLAQDLIQDLRDDMAGEEARFLRPRVFRDDLVGIEVETG